MSNLFVDEIYNPHDDWKFPVGPVFNGCFIDIGTRNMGIRFSSYDGERIEGKLQTKADYDLAKGVKKTRESLKGKSQVGIENDKFFCMIDHMNSLKDHFIDCHFVIIEHQLEHIATARKNVKVMNILIGCLMLLVKNGGNRPIILLISAKAKTRLLGAPKKLAKEEVKDWCFEKSLELIKENKGEVDEELSQLLPKLPRSGKNKRDEHGDIICFCHVFWKFIFPYLRKTYGSDN